MEENEELLFAQLGNFAKLPPELRLKIWGYLFSSCCLRTTLPEPGHGRELRNLSILCANQHLYGEVSHYLFSRLRYTINLHPDYDKQRWMTADVYSRGLSVSCDLKDMAEVERHFQSFRHRKPRLYVKISAPSRRDPGQIVLLWQKANALVDLLSPKHQPRRRGLRITIELGRGWHCRGKLKESIKSREHYHPDVDIAVLPFCRLAPKWRVLICLVDNSLSAALKNEPASRRSELSRVPDAYPKEGGELSSKEDTLRALEIDQWLTDAREFLEESLDEIHGKTANLLRRYRFKNWFEDGDSWKSVYEERLLSQFPGNLETVLKHDYGLLGASKRHQLSIQLHHYAHAKRDGEEKITETLKARKPHLYTTWDSKIWDTAFPKGLRDLRSLRYSLPRWFRWYDKSVYGAYKEEIPQISSFSDARYWWGSEAEVILGEPKENFFKYYECCICGTQKSPCRWCKEYDRNERCRLCREFNKTGKWVGFNCLKCKYEDFDLPCSSCLKFDRYWNCERCKDSDWFYWPDVASDCD